MKWTVEKLMECEFHLYKVLRKASFRVSRVTHFPQKYIYYAISKDTTWGTKGAIIQTSPLLSICNYPFQEPNIAVTKLGITQLTPNRHNSIPHNSLAIERCRRIWSTNSLLDVQIQHQSAINIAVFLKLSVVNIFPSTAIHVKKASLGGALTFHMLLLGNEVTPSPSDLRSLYLGIHA